MNRMEMQMEFLRKMPAPEELKKEFPTDARVRAVKDRRDREIADIFTGKDHRLLLLIGPCSADREDAVMEYMYRLARVNEQVKDSLLIGPRVYTNKPPITAICPICSAMWRSERVP